MGKIDGLEKFDATFFGVHFKQGTLIDVVYMAEFYENSIEKPHFFFDLKPT